jgi:hypothetical protein
MLLTTNSNSRTSRSDPLNVAARIWFRSAPGVPVVRACGPRSELQPKLRSWEACGVIRSRKQDLQFGYRGGGE